MILAAGRGTRLLPLTASVPKILVPVLGVPMLDRLAGFLSRGGAAPLAMNTHHRPEAVARHLGHAAEGGAFPAVRLFHEPELLGTGGGVANVAPFWEAGALLVWNGDIVADLDPGRLAAAHGQTGALATLVVQERQTDSLLLVDEGGWCCGIDSTRRGEQRVVRRPQGELRRRAFSGISLLAPGLRAHLGAPPPFDLVTVLLEASAAGAAIATFDAGASFWGTTGSPERLADLEARLAARPDLLARWAPPGG